eukprot:2867125-Amphidinium_carterae.1
METKWQAWNLRGSALDAKRSLSMTSPLAPPAARVAELESKLIFHPAHTPVPLWMREICSLRKHTSGSVLRVEHADQTSFYWILYASLSPYKLVCKPIEVSERSLQVPYRFASFPAMRACADEHPLWRFQMLPGTLVDPHRDLDFEPKIALLLDAYMSRDNTI